MSHLCLLKNLVPGKVAICAKAMKEIKKRTCETDKGKIEERNYVSELKCAICTMLRDKKGKVMDSDFMMSIEISKHFDGKDQESVDFYPDLVFHENHDSTDLDEEKQHLICEVKTTKYIYQKCFSHDFHKLNLYIDKLHFRTAIYILVNCDYKKIEKKLKFYYNENGYISDNAQNIYFLVQPDLEKEVEIYRFNPQINK